MYATSTLTARNSAFATNALGQQVRISMTLVRRVAATRAIYSHARIKALGFAAARNDDANAYAAALAWT